MKHSLSGCGARALALLVALAGFVGANTAQAQVLNSLMFFNGSKSGGGITLGTDGALYGVASESQIGGGATAGLIYRVTTDAGQVNTIYQYGRLGVYTGGGPHGTLAVDSTGMLYGTTSFTDVDSRFGFAIGGGTVFKISQSGAYTRLYSFSDFATTTAPYVNADGAAPVGSLLLTSDGFLYGTTSAGGANGAGTIFKIATNGTGFAVLHSFAAATALNDDKQPINADGIQSQARLTLASNGDLYGTAPLGGVNGTGVIFRLHTDGTGFTVLMPFDVSPVIDTTTGAIKTNTTGAYPSSGVLQASNGLLYGTANQLGAKGGGSIYRIAADGSNFTVLNSLDGSAGAFPGGDLIVANDGTIVGTTSAGGTTTGGLTGAGTLFSMSLDGAVFNTLYVFGTDGAAPVTGVVQTPDGAFYGTTSAGSPYGIGTVYKFGEATNRTPLGTPQPYDDGSGSFEWWMVAALLALTIARLPRRKSVSRLVG